MQAGFFGSLISSNFLDSSNFHLAALLGLISNDSRVVSYKNGKMMNWVSKTQITKRERPIIVLEMSQLQNSD